MTKLFFILTCIFSAPALGLSFSASPNPINVSASEALGITTLSWDVPAGTQVEVRIDSIDGPLFTAASGSGSAVTGKWVQDGMKFLLVEKKTATVLSSISVRVQSTPAGQVNKFEATPNPIPVAAGETLGATTLNWNVSNVSAIEIRVDSASGPLFAAGSGIGSAKTEKWVQEGTTFYLINKSTGQTLSTLQMHLLAPAPAPTPAPIPVPEPSFSRSILEPFNVTNPAGMFLVDHLGKPFDRPYLQARYQRPNPADANSTPIRFETGFNALASTGLGPLAPSFQRGPAGGSGAQSTFQLKGTEVGIYMRSTDSPHPSKLPACQPNCSGYQKHTVYEQIWSQPAQIFSATNANRALEVEADIQIPEFQSWNALTNTGPLGVLAGQFAFVIFLTDSAGHQIQYVVMVFDSRSFEPGNELLMLEVLGDGNNGYFVMSSFKNDPTKKYTTISANTTGYLHVPWSGYRNFNLKLTPQNILNAIRDLNAKGGHLSTDVWNYRISEVGINQEVYYEDNGDAWTMGASIRNLRVRETAP